MTRQSKQNAPLLAALAVACAGDRALSPPAAVARVVVAPKDVVVKPGDSTEFVAVAYTADGTVADVSMTWRATHGTIRSMGESGGHHAGRYHAGVQCGTGTVTAIAQPGDRADTAAVTVACPPPVASVEVTPSAASLVVGLTARLQATPRDSAGAPLARPVSWATSDTAVVTVDDSGVVAAVAPGVATVTATSEGRSGTATVSVAPVPVASVQVAPTTATIRIGETAQLIATPRDSSGNPLIGREVTWSSDTPGVATVDSVGLVRGITAGTATITAVSEGASGTGAIMVEDWVPVAAVEVTPATIGVYVQWSVRLTATPRDANGDALPGRLVTWSSGDPAVAAVDGAGLVTGVGAGSTTITATSEGTSGMATVTVQPAPVATVEVTPPTATVSVGASGQLTATLRDANGNLLGGRTITWSSDDPSAVEVSAAGLVTAVGNGTATITATSEGRSGTATITTTRSAVASVQVTPQASTLWLGSTLGLSAIVTDAKGNTVTDRIVTWSTSDAAVATVDGAGRVTAVAVGTVTITATSEAVSGAAAVTVTLPPAVAYVDVLPAAATLWVGSAIQLTATPLDAGGTPLAGRAVTWSSSNASVAAVGEDGLVIGIAPGSATITATSEGASGIAAITVQTAPTNGVVFVGAGDIASCGSDRDEATAALLDTIPGVVFTAGDHAYPDGTVAEFTACYGPSWGRHKSRTRPAPGNHDYNTADGGPYYAYFGAAAGDSGVGYYSYDHGAWHVISLNSNISMAAGSPQEQWLRADLAATTGRCVAAYWHHATFSSGDHGNATWTKPIWDVLYEFDADLVVVGHDHTYERFAPQAPDGSRDDVRGIRQFVVGTGGASLYTITSPIANSETHSDAAHGVLKLTLFDGSYAWEFIPAAPGTYTDAGYGTCH